MTREALGDVHECRAIFACDVHRHQVMALRPFLHLIMWCRAVMTDLSSCVDMRVLRYAGCTIGVLALLAMAVLDPLWTTLNLHVPGEPQSPANFTEAVDSIFYIRNAQLGYRWSSDAPTSLWFHPLVSWAISAMPAVVSPGQRFWFLSLAAAFVSLILAYRLICLFSPSPVHPSLLLVVPVLPGFLGMATANAEIPCLLFTSLLTLAVFAEWPLSIVVILGALSALTKPNAVYMLPALFYSVLYCSLRGRSPIAERSKFGIVGIVLSFLLWTLYVDFQLGEFWGYWRVRSLGATIPNQMPTALLDRLADGIYTGATATELTRIAHSILIPIVDMVLCIFVPIRSAMMRNFLYCQFLGLLIVTIVTNNPNKVIVYATTIPAHLIVNALFLNNCLGVMARKVGSKRMNGNLTVRSTEQQANVRDTKSCARILIAGTYCAYCLILAVYYLLGTPLEWFY